MKIIRNKKDIFVLTGLTLLMYSILHLVFLFLKDLFTVLF